MAASSSLHPVFSSKIRLVAIDLTPGAMLSASAQGLPSRHPMKTTLIVVGACLATLTAAGCSSPGVNHGSGGGSGTGGGTGTGGVGSSGGGGSSGSGGSGTAGGSGSAGGTGMAPPPTCVETTSPPSCQTSCANGTTTLTGTVFAPNGTLPLYNAIVYVPSQATTSETAGVTCGACDGQVSGDPIVTTLTGSDGTFTLANVPPGAQIPLVVQMGKWRKQTTVNVPSCATTAVDAASTTLPKNSSEGDMPKIAIATGSVDPFECLLLKIGIDPAEIQPDSANTRVAFFTAAHSPGTTMSGATSATSLYASLTKLLNYDIVVLPCEGGEYDQSTSGGVFGIGGTPLNPDPRGLMVQYLNMGGRLFTTHYSYDWLTYTGSPFNAISKTLVNGLWDKDQSDYPQDDTTTTVAQLVTNFPKGMAFAQWLIAAGAMSAMNTLNIQAIRHDIDDVDPTLAQSWATDTMTDGKAGIAHLTFNTPLDPTSTIDNPGLYCGRAVFSDFHVASDEVTGSGQGQGGGVFPGACVGGPMTDQEKALAFMLFDLSSCVQPDGNPPVAPPIT